MSKGFAVNQLSYQQIEEIVVYMKTRNFDGYSPYIEERPRGWFCNLQPTRSEKGKLKYPQFDLTRFRFGNIKGKQLVHLIWWRFLNNGQLIDPELDISHLDAEAGYLSVVQETREMNESRKFCHLFCWYKVLPGEDVKRCPHRENPCTGP
jgi:hypothetical protein